MNDDSIIRWSFLCGKLVFAGFFVLALVSVGDNIVSAAKVSLFVTLLGFGFLLLKPMFFGVVAGLTVFLLLGFLQVATRKRAAGSAKDPKAPQSVKEEGSNE